jgi:hypothetical protein
MAQLCGSGTLVSHHRDHSAVCKECGQRLRGMHSRANVKEIARMTDVPLIREKAMSE